VLGAGELAANALRDGADLVRPGMCSISAGIAALAIGVFLGSQVPTSPGMHVASLETYLASDLEERESSPELPAPPRASFDERFAGAAVSPGSAPARTVETEEEGADNQPLQPPERATALPAVGGSAPQVAPVTSSPLAGASKKRIRTADLSTDLSCPERVIPKISQETLAEMVGTTRARVNFFMNKFRKMGLIDYNGDLEIHSSLLDVVLYDEPRVTGSSLRE